MSERDKPLYGCELAKALGWSAAMITASRAAGYQFQYGSKTTIRHYLKWRAANPDFRITSYVRAHSKQVPDAKGLSQRSRGRQAETSHSIGEP